MLHKLMKRRSEIFTVSFRWFPILKIPRFKDSPFLRFPLLKIPAFKDSPF